jgi:hypothetical protein
MLPEDDLSRMFWKALRDCKTPTLGRLAREVIIVALKGAYLRDYVAVQNNWKPANVKGVTFSGGMLGELLPRRTIGRGSREAQPGPADYFAPPCPGRDDVAPTHP